MKKPILIILGALLLFAFGMQVYMFNSIHDLIEQRMVTDANLDRSSHEGSNTWIQDSNHWNPYQEILKMRSQMDELFNDAVTKFHENSTPGALIRMPAVDLKDEKERYVVTADVPGADLSSLNVALNGRQLTLSIKTESIKNQTEDNKQYQRRERFNGEFQRVLTLPGDVKAADMKTEFNNGVLTIIVPKA